MNKGISLGDILHPIKRFIRHFHTTLFFVIVIASLSYAVVLISHTVMDAASGTGGVSTTAPVSFDTATMQQLKSFYSSDQAPKDISLPDGRINPFSE